MKRYPIMEELIRNTCWRHGVTVRDVQWESVVNKVEKANGKTERVYVYLQDDGPGWRSMEHQGPGPETHNQQRDQLRRAIARLVPSHVTVRIQSRYSKLDWITDPNTNQG